MDTQKNPPAYEPVAPNAVPPPSAFQYNAAPPPPPPTYGFTAPTAPVRPVGPSTAFGTFLTENPDSMKNSKNFRLEFFSNFWIIRILNFQLSGESMTKLSIMSSFQLHLRN